MKTWIVVVALLCAALFSPACTQPDEARRVLIAAGYTEIKITGYRYFMAGEDETYSTGFRAISPGGEEVTGAVTSGVLKKGKTIRLD